MKRMIDSPQLIRVSKVYQKSKLALFCFLISATFLAICSKSSPLYPMNDWVDVHCFLTLGKGILNGLVPYRDLYEQKGPLLYLIYAVVSLFSQKDFFGQYLLEVISFGFFLYFSAKLARLHLGESRLVYLIVPTLAMIIGTSKAFAHGGSVEQLCLFIFVYGLYSVSCACHENRTLSKKEATLNGVFCAALFWIKFTMVGYYMGLCLFVIIWYLGWVRNTRQLLITIGQFLLGFGLVSIVILGYHYATHSLANLWECYFYNNIFLYPNDSSEPLLDQIRTRVLSSLNSNATFLYLLVAGFSYLLIRAKSFPRDVIAVLFSFCGLTAGTFFGKGYVYYGLVMSAYLILGLIGVAKLIQKIPRNQIIPAKVAKSGIASALVIALFCSVMLTHSYQKSENVYLMKYDKEDLPPYKFAETINQVENATLLNFGFLDAGFYHAADVLPNCTFFCTFNVNAPGMWETQYAYIKHGLVDFVITRRKPLTEYNCDSSKYELVDTANMIFEGYDFTYYLYQLKEDA